MSETWPQQAISRFVKSFRADPETGCWKWDRARNRDGYGRFSIHSQWKLAHRFAYELMRGPIPHDLVIDHLCRVRHCVNPSHLELVTPAENIYRGEGFVGRQHRQTECLRGHPFNDHNTRTNNGTRQCRICDRDRKRDAYQRNKGTR